MKEIVIKENKVRLLLMFIGALIFGISSFFMMFNDGGKYGPIGNLIFGFLGTIFSLPCAFFLFKNLRNPKDILIINEKGFIDMTYDKSVGFVPWENVAKITYKTFYKYKYINVEVININKLFENLSKRQVINLKAYMSTTKSPICIELNYNKKKYDEIIKLMNIYFENYRINYMQS